MLAADQRLQEPGTQNRFREDVRQHQQEVYLECAVVQVSTLVTYYNQVYWKSFCSEIPEPYHEGIYTRYDRPPLL